MREKLVRDLIPEIIRSHEEGCLARVITDDTEYYTLLQKKLLEEAAEFIDNDEIIELADITEVIYAILEYRGINLNNFENMRLKKRNTRGGFKKRVCLQIVPAREMNN